MVEDQMRLIRADLERNAASQKINFEKLLEASGYTKESWEKEAKDLAEHRVKASLVLQTLAGELKIKIDDEEVSAKISELRDVYKKSPEALKNLKDPRVKMDVRNRMAIEKTLDTLVELNSK